MKSSTITTFSLVGVASATYGTHSGSIQHACAGELVTEAGHVQCVVTVTENSPASGPTGFSEYVAPTPTPTSSSCVRICVQGVCGCASTILGSNNLSPQTAAQTPSPPVPTNPMYAPQGHHHHHGKDKTEITVDTMVIGNVAATYANNSPALPPTTMSTLVYRNTTKTVTTTDFETDVWTATKTQTKTNTDTVFKTKTVVHEHTQVQTVTAHVNTITTLPVVQSVTGSDVVTTTVTTDVRGCYTQYAQAACVNGQGQCPTSTVHCVPHAYPTAMYRALSNMTATALGSHQVGGLNYTASASAPSN